MITNLSVWKMFTNLSDGQELGELVSTERNTYTNDGSVSQFDFHQSDKSKAQCVLLLANFSLLE